MQAIRRIIERVKGWRPYRAWERYSRHNGDLLAAGVGYFAFFSIFPVLALAFTVFGIVLRGHPDLLDAIANSLNQSLPGMVQTPHNPNGIITLSAPHATTLTITGIVGFVTLVLAGLGWIGAMRTGIRAIYGLDASPGNAVTTKLRDLGVLVTFGLAVALSAILTSAVGGVAEHLAGWVGLDGQTWIVTVAGLVVSAVFDTFLMVVLLRLLSGVPLPWPDVRGGALVGGVALTAMKYFGGFLIARATRNPLLGAVAVSVGLLFWLNLISRVVLISAAWSANDHDVAQLARGENASDPAVPTVPPLISYDAGPALAGNGSSQGGPALASSRAQDRITLTIGAAVGAVAAIAVEMLRRSRHTS